MPAVILNAGLILLGSLMGVLFRNHIGARLNTILSHALGLCVLSIGFSSAIDTENTLCVIVCMVAGTILGELLRIEEHLDAAGGLLRKSWSGAEMPADSPRALSLPPSSSAWAPWPLWAPWRRAFRAGTIF